MSEERKNISLRDMLQVDGEILENISSLAKDGAVEMLTNIIADLHAADIAEIINHLHIDEAKLLFHLLEHETAAEVLVELDENLRVKILDDIETSKITRIVDELDTDDATDIVANLPEEVQETVLKNLDPEYSVDVKELLKYPEDTAGGIMNSEFIEIDENATVKEGIDEIRKYAKQIDHIYHLYVVNDKKQLIGVVQLKSLLIHPLEEKISSVIEEDLIYVHPEADQEEVANVMEKYDLVALPVVDHNKRMLGRITIDDVVDVIHEEAAEDFQKLAGLSDEEEYSHSIIKVSRIRLPWLLLGLMGELISAVVLASFQASIERIIIASFFIPIVMAMGGSSGTQAAIVVVRSIATGDFFVGDTLKRLTKEFGVAILNGLVCSSVLLLVTYFFWQTQFTFSIILSLSLLIIMTNATMVGAITPLALKRFNIDPAIATGPFVTTTNDILGLIIYFTFITNFYLS